MDFSREEYSKHYIVQALFLLMRQYEYENISVTDIVKKAGVGRATFYRYFKSKVDVITFYFEHNKNKFVIEQRFRPRCKEDYYEIVLRVLNVFRQNKEPFRLLRRAHLDSIYLDYLNRNFRNMFSENFPNASVYAPYIYAGMLYNLSMAWLDNDCAESPESLASIIIETVLQ